MFSDCAIAAWWLAGLQLSYFADCGTRLLICGIISLFIGACYCLFDRCVSNTLTVVILLIFNGVTRPWSCKRLSTHLWLNIQYAQLGFVPRFPYEASQVQQFETYHSLTHLSFSPSCKSGLTLAQNWETRQCIRRSSAEFITASSAWIKNWIPNWHLQTPPLSLFLDINSTNCASPVWLEGSIRLSLPLSAVKLKLM